MQFDHVTVRQRILAPDMVPIDHGFAPYASVLERACEVLVHEACDLFHGLAATQGKRPVLPGCATRSLCVDAYDTEVAEQPGANFPQAPPALADSPAGPQRWVSVPRHSCRTAGTASLRSTHAGSPRSTPSSPASA